ncbi:MAG TPA: hypothetical protein DCE44_11230 [Verrucomicrobiales bacterium]|nr:hypothetical protein [Verrucomicrobiales bacterium]
MGRIKQFSTFGFKVKCRSLWAQGEIEPSKSCCVPTSFWLLSEKAHPSQRLPALAQAALRFRQDLIPRWFQVISARQDAVQIQLLRRFPYDVILRTRT